MGKGKKPKPPKNHPHSDRHRNGTDHHPGDNMNVRGEIEIRRSPSLDEEHDTEREEDAASENKKHQIEVITLIFVIIVAGLTGLQDYFTYQYVGISQDTLDAAQRPYVGVDGMRADYFYINKNGMEEASQKLMTGSVALNITEDTKNFGTTPALNFTGSWRIFVDGEEIGKQPKVPDTPSTLFPGQIVHLAGRINGDTYRRVENGQSTLEIEVRVQYDWAKKTTHGCERHQFVPDLSSFYNLGACKH